MHNSMSDIPKEGRSSTRWRRFNQSKQDMRLCTLQAPFSYAININPCGFFWKQLAKNNQEGAICWVPDTFILNDP